jgi:hypothetical protein
MIQTQKRETRPTDYLQADEFAAPRWIDWWYHRFAPHPPVGRAATLAERMKIRRGRIASIVLLIQLIGIELPVIPIVATAPNHTIVLPWLLSCIAALLVAFACNRRGYLTVAGLLMVGSIEVTVGIKIVTVPGGISVFSLPQFDILVQPILIAMSLLVPWSAFVIAGINIVFVIAALTFGPHAPDLVAVLHNPSLVGDAFAVPIMTQVLAATFACLIVSNLLETIKRVDVAEQVAALEHQLVESQRQAVARTQELEQGFHAVVAVMQRISNGDYQARIELPTNNLLWPITRQFNQILNRYETARVAEAQLGATWRAIDELANEIHQATQQHRPLDLQRRHTPLDAVIIAMLAVRRGNQQGGCVQNQSQPPD